MSEIHYFLLGSLLENFKTPYGPNCGLFWQKGRHCRTIEALHSTIPLLSSLSVLATAVRQEREKASELERKE